MLNSRVLLEGNADPGRQEIGNKASETSEIDEIRRI